jgi:hypothetical protein
MLKAGIMDEIAHNPLGTPQGGVISPLLANVYLHYVLDLWFEKIVKRHCRGEAYMVRYADDFVCCFQYKDDAERFYVDLQERLGKFNLFISPEKSKIIAFGRFAASDAVKQGKDKPDAFDFLGFTHYCSTSKHGKFRVKRRTSRKKYKAALTRMKQWVKDNRNVPLPTLMKKLRAKLVGYYRYYGITDNFLMLRPYFHEVMRLLYKWLNRRRLFPEILNGTGSWK